MAGRAGAVSAGAGLEARVQELAVSLGLDVRSQVRVGRRLWGVERRIDLVLTHPVTTRRLGLECKFQATTGTAEEKIPTTVQDIAAWPIDGLVVFDGDGFSPSMRNYLIASGKAVEFADLGDWLRLYFGLPLV